MSWRRLRVVGGDATDGRRRGLGIDDNPFDVMHAAAGAEPIVAAMRTDGVAALCAVGLGRLGNRVPAAAFGADDEPVTGPRFESVQAIAALATGLVGDPGQ